MSLLKKLKTRLEKNLKVKSEDISFVNTSGEIKCSGCGKGIKKGQFVAVIGTNKFSPVHFAWETAVMNWLLYSTKKYCKTCFDKKFRNACQNP